MEKPDTMLCMGCMAEKKYEGKCLLCGYSPSEAPQKDCLPPGTLLKSRYITGRVMSGNGESTLYLGYDTERKVKVTVKEFLPGTLCKRDENSLNVKVLPSHIPLYKTYLAEFAELNYKMINDAIPLRVQKVLEVFSENNTAYAVFEYIHGLSLKSYLEQIGGKLHLEEIKEMMESILDSLDTLHLKGITHRGISPSTLLVNEDFELIIIGFDIAASRTFGSELEFEIFPGYSAPELYNSVARQGAWTDVYSVAGVFYRALTGMAPPAASERVIKDELCEPILHNRDIPLSISQAIMQGLSTDIERRIHTMKDFISRVYRQPVVDDVTRDINLSQINKYVKPQRDVTAVTRKPVGNPVPPVNRKPEPKPSGAPVLSIGILLSVIVIGCLIAIFYPSATVTPPETFPTETVRQTETATTPPLITKTEASSQSEVINTPLYRMPNLISRSYALISNSENYSFLVITPIYEFNPDFGDGIIFEQSIEVGEEVVFGAEITVKVSKGDPLKKLPPYSGMKADLYNELLISMGFKTTLLKEYSDDVPEGFVTRCDVPVGELIDATSGKVIKIYYSDGQPPELEELPEGDWEF